MRTTVNIDQELLTQAKIVAARNHQPLGAVIDDALRAMLGREGETPTARPVVLETDGGSGLQPGIDLDDKDSLAELLGDNALPGAAR